MSKKKPPGGAPKKTSASRPAARSEATSKAASPKKPARRPEPTQPPAPAAKKLPAKGEGKPTGAVSSKGAPARPAEKTPPARAAAGTAPGKGSLKSSREGKSKGASGAEGTGRSGRTEPLRQQRRLGAAELARIRSMLSQKKQAISNHMQSELSELEKPEKRHRADLEEIASDTHDTDSLCEIMDIEASQMGQIDTALMKIDNGTYGICEDCGEEIPLPRLEALPFATQCIECKRKAEIEGQIAANDQSNLSS